MSQVYSIPREEGEQGRVHGLPTLTLVNDASLSYSFFMNTSQDHVPNNGAHHFSQQVHQKEPNEQFLFIRSTDHPVSFPANKDQAQLHDRYATEKDDPNGTAEWMPSKMRFIKKMMNSDHMVTNKPRRRIAPGVLLQDQTELNREGATSNHTHSSLNGIIRVCSDCNTTKTPLWRSGPRGPKSLCNACGIRQRKARRAAMAAAAAAANGGLIPNDVHAKVRKEKRANDDRTVPFKKRCKFTTGTAQKNVRFDDFTISLSKSSAFQYQVFPQDERDAAILLMALSCGLIRS